MNYSVLIKTLNRGAFNKAGAKAYHISRVNLEMMKEMLTSNPESLLEIVNICLDSRGKDLRTSKAVTTVTL